MIKSQTVISITTQQTNKQNNLAKKKIGNFSKINKTKQQVDETLLFYYLCPLKRLLLMMWAAKPVFNLRTGTEVEGRIFLSSF